MPPEAPLIRTFCPARTLPWSRTARRATVPGHRNSRGLLEREVGRLGRQRVFEDGRLDGVKRLGDPV
jgi:hypothetical protein